MVNKLTIKNTFVLHTLHIRIMHSAKKKVLQLRKFKLESGKEPELIIKEAYELVQAPGDASLEQSYLRKKKQAPDCNTLADCKVNECKNTEKNPDLFFE